MKPNPSHTSRAFRIVPHMSTAEMLRRIHPLLRLLKPEINFYPVENADKGLKFGGYEVEVRCMRFSGTLHSWYIAQADSLLSSGNAGGSAVGLLTDVYIRFLVLCGLECLLRPRFGLSSPHLVLCRIVVPVVCYI